MRMAMLAGAVVTAAALGGCNLQTDVATIEANAAQLMAQINQNAPIILDAAQNTVANACTLVPTVQVAVATFSAGLSNPGSKTTAALTKANAYLSAAAASCTTLQTRIDTSTPITAAELIQLATTIWTSYQAGKSAYQAAITAAAT